MGLQRRMGDLACMTGRHACADARVVDCRRCRVTEWFKQPRSATIGKAVREAVTQRAGAGGRRPNTRTDSITRQRRWQLGKLIVKVANR